MTDEKLRVLYIAGSGRSGSTLLAAVLGQVPGYFCAGELRYLWQRGLIENRLCGCGAAFRECPTWRAILEEAGAHAVDAASMVELQRTVTRVRHVPALLVSRRRRDSVTLRLGDHPDTVERLYRAIRTVTGCDVVVDSSKLPAYGFLLDELPGLDLRVVHLIRDPRAAAFSWMRPKDLPDRASPARMMSLGPLRSALLWDVWNLAAEAFWGGDPGRYLRLRYEELAERPRAAVERVLAFMGDAGRALPFEGERTAVLEPTHTVAGNPVRLERGRVEIRPDDRWGREMRPLPKTAVTAATSPLLGRYGYRLTVSR